MTTLTHVLKASGRFCWRLSPLFRLLSVVIYYIVGVYYYHSTEDWTVIDSVYFVTVSVATIGYGDLHPSSDSGRLFTSFYLIAGLLFVLSAVDELVRHGILKYQSAVMEQLFPDQSLKDRSVKKLIVSVSLLTMLAALGVLFFTLNEGWSAATAIYWTVGTMMTVGYGDLAETTRSTRLFSIFFIAVCVVVYGTTMYNIREFYRLSEPPTARAADLRAQDAAREAEEAEGYKQSTAYLENGFSPLPSADPMESETDAQSLHGGVSNPVLYPHTTNNTNASASSSAHNNAHPMYTTSSSSGSVFVRAVLPVPPRYAPMSRRSARTGSNSMPHMNHTNTLNGTGDTSATATGSNVNSNSTNNTTINNTTRATNTNTSSMHNEILTAAEASTVVDPTQHLLAVLEQINAGSSFARDLAALKKKYDLAVPHDSRVQMTKQELLELCAGRTPVTPHSPGPHTELSPPSR